MTTAFLIPAGDQLIVEIDGKMHSLRRLLGVDKVEVLTAAEGLEHVDNYIEHVVPALVPVA